MSKAAVAVITGATLALLLPAWLATSASPSSETQKSKTAPRKMQSDLTNAPQCHVGGQEVITIKCEYTIDSDAEVRGGARIALDRAVLSFTTSEEGRMHVDLTFTNLGTSYVTNDRTAYLLINDAAGHNQLSRSLPSVDFTRLVPGKPATFSTEFLSGAFKESLYTIYLWIPDLDPLLKFNSNYNLILSSVGVAQPSTGLNLIASFKIQR